ncbi:hypothetical protein N9954_05135 [Maribacter sp.]|nr:hypothetical protein [Maribacter sp.]
MTKKYSLAFLLMLPALFFGNNIGTSDDNSKPEPLTVAESKANAAYFAVQLPDDPNCSGSDTFSWENNVYITNSGSVHADVRFVDYRTALTFQIPGPYPIEFANPVTININEAISWDGYANRSHTPDQLYERWKVVFLKNGVVQFESDYTGDLQDGVDSDQWKGALNQNIELPNGVDQILLVHYEDDTYGTSRVPSANSVVPSSVCFSYEPICNIEVDAGDAIEECTEENVELTASFSNHNNCITSCVFPVLDQLKCNGTNPDSEEVYLFIPGGNANDRKFNAYDQNFETFSDGTARYSATAANGDDVVQVNMIYSGRTSTPPANSPKEHSCDYNQQTAGFEYYPNLYGTIVSEKHGTFYATSMGPSFQIGDGADVTRTGFGASGWFNLTGGDGYYSNGDINIPLGNCDDQGTEGVGIQWSTTDGTIVGASNQETIEVSESGTYTVTVTNCNGCEATDTVEVNILEKLTIGDFAWEDLNRNGLQDTDEPGVDDMTVTLFEADGPEVESTVTANGGAYSFEVCPGEYYVVFGTIPTGFELTAANAGDDASDSDANANGRSPNFVLSDTDNLTIDVGIVSLCNIDPTVSDDEEVCSGEAATLTATGGNAYLWSTGETTASITVAPTATTTYTVMVSDSTIPDCSEELSVMVNVTEQLTIGDFVFDDADNDGLQGANEVGIDGLTVSLYTADGTLTGSTVSANGGEYTFEVCPGEYYIVFGNVPADYAFTNADAGDDSLDSDANANGRTPNFVITDTDNTTIDAGLVNLCTIDATIDGNEQVCAGEASLIIVTGGNTFLWSTGSTAPFINVRPTVTTTYTVLVSDSTIPDCNQTLEFTVNVTEKFTIGDFIFEDVNRNGLQDVDEPGVDDLLVTLYHVAGDVAGSTVSTNGGAYYFEVCPGEYYVVFGDVPAGYTFTNADAGDDSLDSDADENGRTASFVITDADNRTIDAGLVKLCAIDPTVDGDDEICAGEAATLVATGGDTYLWSTGETSASIQVAPEATTTYTVVVSDSATADCAEQVSFTVIVQSVNIDAGPDVTIAFGDSTTLTVSGADASDSIIWSTGETTTSITVAPEVTATYSVTVVNALGCIDEDSVTVNVNDECGIKPAFKIIPRDQPGVYTPGNETAACIGDNLYLWMYAEVENLEDPLAEDYSDWAFTYEFPNGTVVVQNVGTSYPGSHRTEKLDLTEDDFGVYNISWVSPTGCTGSTVFTLNFPDEGCGANGTRTSNIFGVDAVYPVPAPAGSEIVLEISTKNGSPSSIAGNSANSSNGKMPELVSRKETVRVNLYNFDGRKVGNTQTFEVEQGKAKVYFQLGNLAAGTYIVKINGTLWTDSKQIIVK